jgi:hypothetical protein
VIIEIAELKPHSTSTALPTFIAAINERDSCFFFLQSLDFVFFHPAKDPVFVLFNFVPLKWVCRSSIL